MGVNVQTRIAVLGTLAEFHQEAIPYDMSRLLELVVQINPDLLCLDITSRQWLEQDFEKLPSDYRDVLLPLARHTDIVVAPIGGELIPSNGIIAGKRLRAILRLRKWIGVIQRTAPGPEAMNHGWRHDLVNTLYYAIRRLNSRERRLEVWAYADYLTEQLLAVCQRDPGARVLAVVNVQYCHLIRERLQKCDAVSFTGYSDL